MPLHHPFTAVALYHIIAYPERYYSTKIVFYHCATLPFYSSASVPRCHSATLTLYHCTTHPCTILQFDDAIIPHVYTPTDLWLYHSTIHILPQYPVNYTDHRNTPRPNRSRCSLDRANPTTPCRYATLPHHVIPKNDPATKPPAATTAQSDNPMKLQPPRYTTEGVCIWGGSCLPVPQTGVWLWK